MSYIATVFNVVIASLNDVATERNIIREVLAEWNVINADRRTIVLLPVSWETHASPTMGERPQAIINKQVLKDCDLLVGVFWTRIGTPTGEYASGTVEEIEEHIKTGKPAMLYFSDAPVRPDGVDNDQYSALKEFKNSCKARGIFETYTDVNEFKSKFYRQLQLKLNQDEHFTKITPPSGELEVGQSSVPDIPRMSKEAQVLLKEASQDPNGRILRLPHSGGLTLQTNQENFTADSTPRTIALWEGALEELEQQGLVQGQGHERKVFAVTREGYAIADLINP